MALSSLLIEESVFESNAVQVSMDGGGSVDVTVRLNTDPTGNAVVALLALDETDPNATDSVYFFSIHIETFVIDFLIF